MSSSFTPNKSIEQPSSGSYTDSWATPVNQDWAIIDNALGGVTTISVTGVPAGTYVLTLSQYQPPNIEISGVLSGNITYQVPTNVGGIWTVENNTGGAYTISFGCEGGTSVILPQGIQTRSLVVSDGVNVMNALTVAQSFSELSGQIANSQVPSSAVTQYDSLISVAFTQVSGQATTAQIPLLPASQINSGVFANARLPNPGVGPGVTIAADPGTTPSGAPGAIFYYY